MRRATIKIILMAAPAAPAAAEETAAMAAAAVMAATELLIVLVLVEAVAGISIIPDFPMATAVPVEKVLVFVPTMAAMAAAAVMVLAEAEALHADPFLALVRAAAVAAG